MATIGELYPVPAEVKKYYVFVGEWMVDGSLTIEGDAETKKVEGSWSFAIAAGGWGVRSSNKLIIEGLGDYELDNLFGYDKETGTLHIYSITNMAETHDHTAGWPAENVLLGMYDGLKDGKRFREDFRIEFSSPDECTIKYIEKVDGQIDSIMELRLRRRR